MGEPIELIARRERRRRWSVEEKLRIVAETRAADATVAEVARRHDVSANLLYTWRRMAEGRLARTTARAQLVPVRITGQAILSRPVRSAAGKIEIALPDGIRLKLDEGVTPERLAQVLAILRG